MTVAALRDEFRRDPSLPIMIENDTFVKAIHRGVDQGEYVYRRGDLLYGKGDPIAMIMIDEQSVVFTSAFAWGSCSALSLRCAVGTVCVP